jgi:hypothetical protein
MSRRAWSIEVLNFAIFRKIGLYWRLSNNMELKIGPSSHINYKIIINLKKEAVNNADKGLDFIKTDTIIILTLK